MHQLLVAAVILLNTYTSSNPPMSRHDVAIAGDARTALVVWTEIDGNSARIHASPMEHWHDVVMPMSGQQQIAPVVAFDGTNFLVVWQEFDLQRVTTYGERVSRDGTLLDPAPISFGLSAPTFLPRAIFAAGLYRIISGTAVSTMNPAGVVTPILVITPSSTVDAALTNDATVFARAIPGFCSGFSMWTCQPPRNLLTFQPGGDIAVSSKPVWIESEGDAVLWADPTGINVTRGGITHGLLYGASNAAISGSTVVYEKDSKLFKLDVDTLVVTPLANGALSPALLARGDGRITLLYRTTSHPTLLKTMEVGAQAPLRRRTF